MKKPFKKLILRKLVSVMAVKNWSIQGSKRKPGNIVEFWLTYKQNPASVAPCVRIFDADTNDKLVNIEGEDSLPQYIMTDMQKYLASISVFRCRCLGLCKYCALFNGAAHRDSRLQLYAGDCRQGTNLRRKQINYDHGELSKAT